MVFNIKLFGVQLMITKVVIINWLEHYANILAENKEYLTELDSAIGDADHGINMDRGFKKVVEKLPTVKDQDISKILKTVGMTLMSTVGGASGPLYGTFFMQAGNRIQGKEELSDNDFLLLYEDGVSGILKRGRPNLQDKTMYDAMDPALNALKSSLEQKLDFEECLKSMVAAAEKGMKDTIPLQARKGRASYLGERSIGHQDPGATSSYLMLKSLLDVIS